MRRYKDMNGLFISWTIQLELIAKLTLVFAFKLSIHLF